MLYNVHEDYPSCRPHDVSSAFNAKSFVACTNKELLVDKYKGASLWVCSWRFDNRADSG